MRNAPLKGFLKKSPMKDIDTTWADKVFHPNKVDETLKKKGLHTKGDLRGKKDTTPNEGANRGGGTLPINTEI